jgi:ABC-2 type transport system permease protein
VTADAPAALLQSGAGADLRLEPVRVPDAAAAELAVQEGDADAALLTGLDGRYELVAENEIDPALQASIDARVSAATALQGLSERGISPPEATRLLSAPGAAPRLLEPADSDTLTGVLGYASTVTFFVVALTLGIGIAQRVTEEKSNRVVEILAAAVPIRQLLIGKVAGAGLLALGQVALVIVAAGVGLAASGQLDGSLSGGLLSAAAGSYLIFFLLGFLMLSCLWAAVGAMTPRTEDLQSTSLPMQALLFLPFIAAFTVTSAGTAMTWLSYIPVTSPLLMPRRVLLGDAAVWEPFVSGALIVATAILLVLVATRLYENSLLRTRGKTSWREAWSAGARGQ